jgi:hypothetical protein
VATCRCRVCFCGDMWVGSVESRHVWKCGCGGGSGCGRRSGTITPGEEVAPCTSPLVASCGDSVAGRRCCRASGRAQCDGERELAGETTSPRTMPRGPNASSGTAVHTMVVVEAEVKVTVGHGGGGCGNGGGRGTAGRGPSTADHGTGPLQTPHNNLAQHF